MGIFSEMAWKLKGIWIDFSEWFVDYLFPVVYVDDDDIEPPQTEKIDIDIRLSIRARRRR